MIYWYRKQSRMVMDTNREVTHCQEKNKGLVLAIVLTILQVEVAGEMMGEVADEQMCTRGGLIGPRLFKPMVFRNH